MMAKKDTLAYIRWRWTCNSSKQTSNGSWEDEIKDREETIITITTQKEQRQRRARCTAL
eukprot:m.58685 g.58685  ORF g.58685 m.58685 type:complete len:59 (-) comp13167_c0_seq1:249-425(-)